MATDGNVNDEEVKIQETRGDNPPTSSFFQVMNSYGRELCFILALLFTAFAAFQNGPLKSRKANPPEVFFSAPSLVTDFYRGNIKALATILSEKDVALVMYYAPWDSECIQAKDEFELTAKFYHQEVYFAAVNCWWPEGECFQKFKLVSYPVIVAHVHDVGGITFTGPAVANYFISFLDNILSPLVPIQHAGDLLDLQTKHEAVLVAFFDFEESYQPKGYTTFYTAALKALSDDPTRRLGFAVVTSKVAALKFKMKSSVQLYLWNSTEIYPEKLISFKEVLKWAFAQLTQVTRWVTPSRAKSKALSKIIEKSPTLIMFTPRNLMLESSAYYDLFREVALDYSNCNMSSRVTSLIHRIALKRHILQEEFSKLVEKCRLKHNTTVETSQPTQDCCQSLYVNLGFHQASQCPCRVCLHHSVDSVIKAKLSECETTLELVLKGFQMSSLKTYKYCSDIEASYPLKFGAFNRVSFKCHSEPARMHLQTVVKDYPLPGDSLGVKDDHILMMVQNIFKVQCQRIKFALNYSDFNFPEFPPAGNNSWQTNFTGLGCQTNRTLMFISMDAIQFHSFAENLGLDVLRRNHQAVAVIIEAEQESQYVLEGNMNKKILVEFIKNYTSGMLDRFLRSPVRNHEECRKHGYESVCVPEVTTASFSKDVLENENIENGEKNLRTEVVWSEDFSRLGVGTTLGDCYIRRYVTILHKDVVLLYYATWCGACSAISHVFLNVANYFADIKEITFARISGEDNDLPWEYTVEKYPTIIFFPAKRKSESVEFPPHLPITATNLLHFILVHAQLKVRWVVSMQLCNKNCVAHNLIRSSAEIRQLFRESHILRNQLLFVRHLLGSPKEYKRKESPSHISCKTLFCEDSFSVQREGVFMYMKHLLSRVREKRRSIKRALELQNVLRKKRDLFVKNNKDSFLNVDNSDSQREWYNVETSSKVPNDKSETVILSSKLAVGKDEL